MFSILQTWNIQRKDIIKLIKPIYNRQTDIVYGSREIKTYDNKKNLNIIYKNNFSSKIASFYGGKLIKIFLLIFHNLSITDPLCTHLKLLRQIL